MLALLLSAEFNRRGQWKRVVLAVGVGAVVSIVFFALRSLGAKQPWALPLMHVWVFGGLALSVWLLVSGRTFAIPSFGVPRLFKRKAAAS